MCQLKKKRGSEVSGKGIFVENKNKNMAQGKLKVKTKRPPNVKKNLKKGSAATKRANAPVKPKKQKNQEAHKLKQIITKTVNKTVEAEIRAKAGKSSLINLSRAQQAVVNHHKGSTASVSS